jgi:hypothetical protein
LIGVAHRTTTPLRNEGPAYAAKLAAAASMKAAPSATGTVATDLAHTAAEGIGHIPM